MGKRDRDNPNPDYGEQFAKEVYEKYIVLMLQIARNYIGENDAEDLVSTSIVKLFHNEKSLRGLYGKPELLFYIREAIKNNCRNYLKHEKKRKEIFTDCPLEDIDELAIRDLTQGELRAVEEKILEMERMSELRRCIEKLPEHYRIFLEGKYFENLDDDELAKLLGCKKSSLRSVSTRAKRKLKMLLEEEGVEDVIQR